MTIEILIDLNSKMEIWIFWSIQNSSKLLKFYYGICVSRSLQNVPLYTVADLEDASLPQSQPFFTFISVWEKMVKW